MARAENQVLTAILTLKDEMTGPLAAAKQSLTQADQGLARIGTTAKAAGAGLGGLSTGLLQVAKVGATAFVGFQALNIGADFLSGSIQAAREDEESISRLTAALKANVPAWDENKSAIENRISAATASAFADDDLRQSLGSLVTATHDVNRAFDDQSIAIDLARARNISLEEASQTLVAVEAGRFRGLAQLGISIKGVTTSEEALAKIREAVAGQSQAFLETDAGRAEKLAVSVNELQESFGRLASGPLAAAAEKLAQFFDILSGNVAADISAQGDAFVEAIRTNFTDASRTELENLQKMLEEQLHKSRNTLSLFGVDLPVGNFQGESDAIQKALDEVNAALQGTGDFFDREAGHVDESTRSHRDNADAVSDDAQKLIDAALAAGQKADADARLNDVLGLQKDHFGALSDSSLLAGNSLDAATVAAQGLAQQLFDIPTSVNVDVNIVTRRSVALNTGLPAGSADTQIGQAFTPGGNADALAAHQASQATQAQLNAQRAADAAAAAAQRQRDAQQAASEAAAKAKQRAEELARAYHDKVSAEFDRAKDVADRLFDALHRRNQQAIDDAEKLAQKKHDDALQTIADNLKAEQASHATAVNAAEKTLAETQAREARRNLVEARNAAALALQQNRDPTQTADLARSLRDATEALANFDAQAAIDKLKVAQKAADDASQLAADQKTKQANDDLQAAKDQAQKDSDAETLAAKKRKDEFERQLAALQKRDEAAGKTPSQIQKDIDALEKRFGITTDALGFHHIEDPLVGAIKDIKIEPPHVTLVNNQKFVLQVGPNELRLIANAIGNANQPSATSSVRTGANGRG